MRKATIGGVVVLAALCGGLGWLAHQIRKGGAANVTRERFDAQRLGAAQSEVLAALPTPLRDSIVAELHPDDVPADATNAYFPIVPATDNGPDLWCLSFREGVLAEKRAVTFPPPARTR